MEHHAPHANAVFEGYYNKFALPSGAHIIIVISQVKDAKIKPYAFSFVYVPNDTSEIYHKEIFPAQFEMRRLDSKSDAFILDVPGIGYAKWDSDGTTEYKLEHELF